MKTKINQSVTLKNVIFSGLLLIMITVLSSSCSRKIDFLNSEYAPSSEGYVKIKMDKNKNYVLKIEVSNLAEVSRLVPPKQTYVVWMLSDKYIIKNLGQLKSSEHFLGSKPNASFYTVTSLKPIKVYITAEEDPNVKYPNERIFLTTEKFYD
jgi:hypothetical protein